MTCPHGLPGPAACLACMDEGPVAPLAVSRWVVVVTLTGRFESTCPVCDEPIRIGHVICKEERRSGGDLEERWVHARCASGA